MVADKNKELLRVGALAKRVSKSVRAIHLYEELGLLQPAARSAGGFRLFSEAAVERIEWILKLQAIGFSLSEIQGFIREFEGAESGRDATGRVYEVFDAKLREIRTNMERLRNIERELVDSLAYLESCSSCAPEHTPDECHVCAYKDEGAGTPPELFAGLSEVIVANEEKAFDVAASSLSARNNQEND